MTKDIKPAYPLRERRKSRTRAALLEATHALTAEGGFEGFTLEQVAERAEVHVQTLYRHFQTKDELLQAGAEKYLDELEELLEERSEGVTTFDVWRAYVRRYSDVDDQTIDHVHLSHDKYLQGQAQYIELLAKGLAKDMGTGFKNKRRADLLATLLRCSIDLEHSQWLREGRKTKMKTRVNRLFKDLEANFFGDG